MAELRPKVFREPELLEAVSEVLTGRGAKTTIQSSGGREEPCVAQAAACAILAAALKVNVIMMWWANMLYIIGDRGSTPWLTAPLHYVRLVHVENGFPHFHQLRKSCMAFRVPGARRGYVSMGRSVGPCTWYLFFG